MLILDEPTDGLDPNQKRQVRDMIKGLAADKIVVISTHILEEVAAVARAIIINEGEVVLDEEAESLTRRAALMAQYRLRLTGWWRMRSRHRVNSLDPTLPSLAMRRVAIVQRVCGRRRTCIAHWSSARKGWHIADFEQEGGALDILFAASTGAQHV